MNIQMIYRYRTIHIYQTFHPDHRKVATECTGGMNSSSIVTFCDLWDAASQDFPGRVPSLVLRIFMITQVSRRLTLAHGVNPVLNKVTIVFWVLAHAGSRWLTVTPLKFQLVNLINNIRPVKLAFKNASAKTSSAAAGQLLRRSHCSGPCTYGLGYRMYELDHHKFLRTGLVFHLFAFSSLQHG